MPRLVLALRLFGGIVCLAGVYIQFSLLQSSEAIIGGTDASPGEFPYIVSLRNHTGLHYCGGALITRRHVLTAAHCVYADKSVFEGLDEIQLPPENVTAVINSVSINPSSDKIYRVQRLVHHSNYHIGRGQYSFDIAIITLMDEVTDPEVRPIELATDYPMVSQDGIVAGWGIHQKIHKLTLTSDVNTLQKMKVVIYLPVECAKLMERYNTVNPSVVTNIVSLLAERKIFCAMNDEDYTGLCYRDSGGPLIVNNELVGIVAFGIPCAEGYPDMYTAVSNYRSFIKEQIESDDNA